MLIKPKIVIFAGPNGSGKSTITDACNICGTYVNADEIQKHKGLTAYDAAVEATSLRERLVENRADFTFETVLSTERNIDLLKSAKKVGYFIRGFYVLTCTPEINVLRVQTRVQLGGHDVPADKIRVRYMRALQILPEFVELCDVCSIYDNSLDVPCRIYKKYHGETFCTNAVWDKTNIDALLAGEYKPLT